jgi:hypothetical protein
VWLVNVTPRPLYPRARDPVPIVQEARWALGPVWTGAENLVPTGVQIPDRPARSESLYRLSYPGPPFMSFWTEMRQHPNHKCILIYCPRYSEKARRLARNSDRIVSWHRSQWRPGVLRENISVLAVYRGITLSPEIRVTHPAKFATSK